MNVKLMTKEIIDTLPPLRSTEHTPDAKKKIIAKFFTPDSSWTWYVAEGEHLGKGDYEFFGYVEGHENEWGYFRLSDLEKIRGKMGLPVERDRHLSYKTFAEIPSLRAREKNPLSGFTLAAKNGPHRAYYTEPWQHSPGKMDTGIRCETRRLSPYGARLADSDYIGRIVAYENGRRLWAEETGIHRLSRGDALKDARTLASERLLENGGVQKNPGARRHTKKFDRCVKAVKRKGGALNAYAVCHSRIKKSGLEFWIRDEATKKLYKIPARDRQNAIIKFKKAYPSVRAFRVWPRDNTRGYDVFKPKLIRVSPGKKPSFRLHTGRQKRPASRLLQR